MADYNQVAKDIIAKLGGKENITACINCMTRLRITIVDLNKIDKAGLESLDDVLTVNMGNPLQVVVGPGKAQKISAIIQELIKGATPIAPATEEKKTTGVGAMSLNDDWKDNKAKIKGNKKDKWISIFMKHLANIFTPLIPAIIAAGLFAAIGSIVKICGGTMSGSEWKAYNVPIDVIYNICMAFSNGFTAYMVIFVGYNAAKEFGATPMLGGFLGGICSIGNITAIAKDIGLYNPTNPLASTLLAGKGGVIGVIAACALLALVEKFLHKKMPNALDNVLTPFLSILVVGLVYVFGIMIVAGYISDGIVWCITQVTRSPYVIVRILVGFLAAALFLPLVMTGMHHGLVAFYATELAEVGFVSLYPVLAMAGAGQVGAAVALWIKAKKLNFKPIKKNVEASIIPGILGVGEPLIYSVTLPLLLPFITAGLGAGIGGAFVLAFEVGSTAWGPSGVLAIPLMTYVGGQASMNGMWLYSIGLVLAIVFGFIFTWFICTDKVLIKKKRQIVGDEVSPELAAAGVTPIEENSSNEETKN